MRAARTSVTMVLVGFSVSSLIYRRFLDPCFRQAFTSCTIDIIGNGLLARQLRQHLLNAQFLHGLRVYAYDSYVRYHSLFLDLSTLLKTAYTVLFAKGR